MSGQRNGLRGDRLDRADEGGFARMDKARAPGRADGLVQRKASREAEGSTLEGRRGLTIDAFSVADTAPAVQLEAFDSAVARTHEAVAEADGGLFGGRSGRASRTAFDGPTSADTFDLMGGARSAPIQMKTDGHTGRDTDDIQSAAAHGTRGGGGKLPYFERIQAAFGNHDISGIRSHVGGAAREASDAIGAEAYATGSSVAFRSAPSLHTAAHEAAHIVQQRAGVSLKGGVGESGDRYERHADAVADAVVSGKSAEGLLGPVRSGCVGGVQKKDGNRGSGAVNANSNQDNNKKQNRAKLEAGLNFLHQFNSFLKGETELELGGRLPAATTIIPQAPWLSISAGTSFSVTFNYDQSKLLLASGLIERALNGTLTNENANQALKKLNEFVKSVSGITLKAAMVFTAHITGLPAVGFEVKLGAQNSLSSPAGGIKKGRSIICDGATNLFFEVKATDQLESFYEQTTGNQLQKISREAALLKFKLSIGPTDVRFSEFHFRSGFNDWVNWTRVVKAHQPWQESVSKLSAQAAEGAGSNARQPGTSCEQQNKFKRFSQGFNDHLENNANRFRR